MASKRKRSQDELESEIKKLQDEVSTLKQELKKVKEDVEAPDTAESAVTSQFQQRGFVANSMILAAIRDGNLNKNTAGIQSLVVTYPFEINAQKAFHYAVECNQLLIAKFLLHVYGPTNESNPVLKNRIKIDDLGTYQTKTEVTKVEESDKETPLQTAVRIGSKDLVATLLSAGARETLRTPRRRFSLLHLAVIENHPDLVREILSTTSINVNIRDTDGWAPLHWAAEQGHVEVVKALVEHPKCQIDITDSARRTPIHFAVVEGGPRQRECIKYLWSKGADINMRQSTGSTPLDIARECKQTECVALLKKLSKLTDRDTVLSEEPDLPDAATAATTTTTTTTSSHTGADSSISPRQKNGLGDEPGVVYEDIPELVIHDTDSEHDSDSSGDEARNLMRNKSARSSRKSAGADVDLAGAVQSMSAAEQAEIIDLIIKGHIDMVNHTDSNISVPALLFKSARDNNFADIVAALHSPDEASLSHATLRNGLSGTSPLHTAAVYGAVDSLRMMVFFADVNLNMLDYKGRTPVFQAARHGQLSALLFLLGRKATFDTVSHNMNHSVLHAAAMSKSPQAPSICKLLVRHGLKVDAKDRKGRTPLWHAANKGNLQVCHVLLQDGAVLTETIINAARRQGHKSIVRHFERCSKGDMSLRFKKHPLIVKDISGGIEKIPIRLINEIDDTMLPLEFGYLTTCVEAPDVVVHYNVVKGCQCSSGTDCESAATCLCAKSNVGTVLYECNYTCNCPPNCSNHVIQKGRKHVLEVYKTPDKGWAVRAMERIPINTFVCEYIGELIDEKEEKRRYPSQWLSLMDATINHAKCAPHATGAAYTHGSFVFDISAMKRIDATVFGNFTRFINHSCDPNLVPIRFFVHHRHTIFPRLAFFSKRDIAAGEELSYDYGSPSATATGTSATAQGISCNCGAAVCRGRL